MTTEPRYVVVTTTVDSDEAAEHITAALLEPRLAPCVQAAAIHSSFWWKGDLQQTDETRLQVKIPASQVPAVLAAIRAVHPYETPEIIVTPILDGDPAYLKWLDSETAPPGPPQPGSPRPR